MPDELDIPAVPTLNPEADGKTDEELDTQIDRLAESELEAEDIDTLGDPRAPEADDPKVEPDDPTVPPQPGEEPEGEPEEELTFADDASDDDKIKAISEKYGGNAEAISKAYLSMQRQSTAQGQENTDLRNVLSEELDKRLPKADEPEADPEKIAQADQDLGALFLTDSEKATQVVQEIAKKAALEAHDSVSHERLIKEAGAHTDQLILNRAKTHLLEAAKLTQDKDGVKRFSNPEYQPTDDELGAVMPTIQQEVTWIGTHLRPDAKTFKLPANAFKIAETVLNQDTLIKDAEKRGTNRTLSQIEQPANAAIIANAKGSKATSVKDGKNIRSREQARGFGRALSDKELDAAISESEPEL